MKKIISVSLSALSAVILTSTSYASGDKSGWGYTGDTAPIHWGSLNKKFSICSNGKLQTPINIVPTKDIDLKPLKFDYNTNSTDVINNGHTIQVNIAGGSNLLIDGKKYELKQFHFHTPSENNINGQQYPLEAHFVHVSKDGKIAVVAVMFKNGEKNQILAKIWDKFPLKETQNVSINLSSNDIKNIMPKNKDYYKFVGSLTTPPCTEGVKWNVFKTVVTISKEQVKQFFDTFGHSNNRPIQNKNNRIIFK